MNEKQQVQYLHMRGSQMMKKDRGAEYICLQKKRLVEYHDYLYTQAPKKIEPRLRASNNTHLIVNILHLPHHRSEDSGYEINEEPLRSAVNKV